MITFLPLKNKKKEPRRNLVVCFSLNEINKTEKTREREASEQKRIGKGRMYDVEALHVIFKLPVI